MSTSPKSRVVVVTGASRGLGKATALRFGRAGDRVVVNYLSNQEAADAVVDTICAQGGYAVRCRADVRIAAEVDAMIDDTIVRWNRIDVVVNNAGVTHDGLMVRMQERNWDAVLDANLTGAFHCLRAAGRVMAQQKDGHIISLASIVALQGREGQANYSASKAALIGLTKAAAREFGPLNVKVNAVAPGYLSTAMGETVHEHMIDRIVRENVLGRIADPEEVADFIFHLSGMEHVSGQVFNLDSRIL